MPSDFMFLPIHIILISQLCINPWCKVQDVAITIRISRALVKHCLNCSGSPPFPKEPISMCWVAGDGSKPADLIWETKFLLAYICQPIGGHQSIHGMCSLWVCIVFFPCSTTKLPLQPPTYVSAHSPNLGTKSNCIWYATSIMHFSDKCQCFSSHEILVVQTDQHVVGHSIKSKTNHICSLYEMCDSY